MRRVVTIMVALAAIIAIVLYVTRDEDDAPSSAEKQPPATTSKRSAAIPLARTPVDEDVSPGLPPPEYKPAERPEVKPLTQEAFIERRAKGLAMLDDMIARVQKEHAQAVAAKDTDRATFTQVRLDRLGAVRKQRAEELEQAKRGELEPDPDDLPAGPRPSREP